MRLLRNKSKHLTDSSARRGAYFVSKNHIIRYANIFPILLIEYREYL